MDGAPAGERIVSGCAVLLAVFVSIGAMVLLVYALWAFWPPTPIPGNRVASSHAASFLGASFTISTETSFFIVVALAGALGGLVHTIRSMVWYAGHRNLKWSWVPFYVLLPFVGVTSGTLFYIVVRAGLISPTASTSAISPYGFAALAALVGLFSEQAIEKLRSVATTFFTEAPKGSDHIDPESGGGAAAE